MKTTFSRLLPYAFILTTGLHVSAAMAAPSSAGFVATLAKAVDAPSSAILDGAMWRCVGDSCKAVDEYQRPQFICAQVVRKFGPLTSFSSHKGELVPKDLAKCNSAK